MVERDDRKSAFNHANSAYDASDFDYLDSIGYDIIDDYMEKVRMISPKGAPSLLERAEGEAYSSTAGQTKTAIRMRRSASEWTITRTSTGLCADSRKAGG